MKKVKLTNDITFEMLEFDFTYKIPIVKEKLQLPEDIVGAEVIELSNTTCDSVCDNYTNTIVFYYQNRIAILTIELYKYSIDEKTDEYIYAPAFINCEILVDYCIIPEADELLKQTNK